MHILYLEDETILAADNIFGAQHFFPDTTILNAVDYSEAEQAAVNAPDLAILDWRCPGKIPGTKTGGLDICALLHKISADTVIYVLSGTDADTIQADLRRAHLPPLPSDQVLSKPGDDLTTAIQSADVKYGLSRDNKKAAGMALVEPRPAA